MDALGIFWLILFSVIAIIAFVKLRTSSTTKKTGNNNNRNSGNSERIYSIAEGNKGFSKDIAIREDTGNKSSNSSDNKARNSDDKNGF